MARHKLNKDDIVFEMSGEISDLLNEYTKLDQQENTTPWAVYLISPLLVLIETARENWPWSDEYLVATDRARQVYEFSTGPISVVAYRSGRNAVFCGLVVDQEGLRDAFAERLVDSALERMSARAKSENTT